MEFEDYQEKPIIPKKIKARKFKKSDATGLCFVGMYSWERFMRNDGSHKYVFSGDVTEEKFEEERKQFSVKKNELMPYTIINDEKVIYKHNQWIVLHEDGKIEVLNDEIFKEKYVKN